MIASSVVSAVSIFAVLAISSVQGTTIPLPLTKVTWNNIYDNGGQSLSSLACSQWASKNNFKTLSDVPGFPFVGGADVVNGTNTAQCGDCYTINDLQTGEAVSVTVVDAAGAGFVVSLEALNNVTNGEAMELGSIAADVQQAPNGKCST